MQQTNIMSWRNHFSNETQTNCLFESIEPLLKYLATCILLTIIIRKFLMIWLFLYIFGFRVSIAIGIYGPFEGCIQSALFHSQEVYIDSRLSLSDRSWSIEKWSRKCYDCFWYFLEIIVLSSDQIWCKRLLYTLCNQSQSDEICDLFSLWVSIVIGLYGPFERCIQSALFLTQKGYTDSRFRLKTKSLWQIFKHWEMILTMLGLLLLFSWNHYIIIKSDMT
jgi:hypothetical protein